MTKFLTLYFFGGFATAVWTAHRAGEKLPAFNGLGDATSPASALAQTFLLWPYAVYDALRSRT